MGQLGFRQAIVYKLLFTRFIQGKNEIWVSPARFRGWKITIVYGPLFTLFIEGKNGIIEVSPSDCLRAIV